MINGKQWDEMVNLASIYQGSYLEEEFTGHSKNDCGYMKDSSAFYQPNKFN
jgi:hypothetical protein